MIINPAPENSSGVPPIPGVQPAPAPGEAPPEIVMAPIILAGEPGPPPIFGPQAPTQPAPADVSAFALGQPGTEPSISNVAETPASSPPPLSPEISQAITYPPAPEAPGQPDSSILPPPPAPTIQETMPQMSPNLSPDTTPSISNSEPASPITTEAQNEPNLGALSEPITEQLKPPEGSDTPLTHTFIKYKEMLQGSEGNPELQRVILESAKKLIDDIAQNEAIPAGSVQLDPTKTQN